MPPLFFMPWLTPTCALIPFPIALQEAKQAMMPTTLTSITTARRSMCEDWWSSFSTLPSPVVIAEAASLTPLMP